MNKSFIYLTIITVLVLISPLTLFSQVDTSDINPEFQVFGYSSPNGIMLVITGDWIIPDANDNLSGYNIYRKDDSAGTFQKITSSPLRAPSSYTNLVTEVGKDLEGMFPVVGVTDSSQFWQLLIDHDESITVWATIFKKFREAMGQLYYDYDIETGKRYYYNCTKVDASGNESPFSREIGVTAGEPLFSLLGPINQDVEVKNNKAVISWKVNPNDSAAFSYNIYRAYDSLGRYQKLNREIVVPMYNEEGQPPSEMKFVDSLISIGRPYYYSVVSVDFADNESGRNQIISVFPQDTKAPSVPKNIKAESGELGIKILWDKSVETDLAGYAVYRSIDPDSVFEKLHEELLPVNSISYEDVTARSGDEYFYRMTAVDQAGNESEQSANIYGYYINSSLPLPPGNMEVVADSGKITLSWAKIDDPEILGYYVFRSNSFKGEFTQISDLIPKEDSVWVDTTSLSSFGTYFYAMKSSTLNGVFSYYNEAAAVAPLLDTTILPEPPTDFYGYADYAGGHLQWKLPLDKKVFGYNIYRMTDMNQTPIKLNDSTILFSTTSFLDTVMIPGQTYIYFIKSVLFEGIEGTPSHQVEISPVSVTPEPPVTFRAVLTNGSVLLKWDRILLDGMAGYNVYKHTGDGAFEKINAELLSLENTEFADRNVQPSQRYYYTITTVAIDNRESFHSTVRDILVE